MPSDKHAPYKTAIEELKNEGIMKQNLNHRQIKYLNNIIEQDHRRIKRLTRSMHGTIFLGYGQEV